MAKILVTGIVGSLAQLTARRLIEEGHEIIGVDYRKPRNDLPPEVQFYRANYNKRRIEDVMKKHAPTHVLHLGRVGNLKTRLNKRFDLNVMGSRKIMDMSLQVGVKRLVVLSTFHIYGAHPHNHIPIFEDEPLRAGTTFPQLADALQLDGQAITFAYQHRKMRTVVLRPTNIVGPQIRNAISTYLRRSRLVYLPGFSPMWQFVHELDMVDAICLALWGRSVGVFNVAGGGELPVIEAFQLTDAKLTPIPHPIASLLMSLSNRLFSTVPEYLLDFLKYPCVISDAKFRKEFDYEPKVGIEETIRSCVGG